MLPVDIYSLYIECCWLISACVCLRVLRYAGCVRVYAGCTLCLSFAIIVASRRISWLAVLLSHRYLVLSSFRTDFLCSLTSLYCPLAAFVLTPSSLFLTYSSSTSWWHENVLGEGRKKSIMPSAVIIIAFGLEQPLCEDNTVTLSSVCFISGHKMQQYTKTL